MRIFVVHMSKSSATFDEILLKLRAMLPLLREKYHVRTLEVFGSYLRGEEGPESDLDLLVTFEEVPTLFQFVGLENFFER